MANFNTHLSVALVASGVAGLVVYKAGMITAYEFLLCSMIGTIGGLLPDIDLGHAVPARVGFHLMSIVSAFVMMVMFSERLSLLELLLVGVVSYATMKYGVFQLFNQLTVHRGIVHSVPYMAVLGMAVVYVSFYGFRYGAVLSWFLGLFLLFGAIIHLLLDEIYSVDVFGMSLKKSFGTALKFFEKQQKFYYLGLYVALVGMAIFAPPFKLFWQTLTDPISWQLLQNNIMPKGLNMPL